MKKRVDEPDINLLIVCCKVYLLPSLHQRGPLHLAAGKGHLDIVKYLVEDKGVDMYVKDTQGVSMTLHY